MTYDEYDFGENATNMNHLLGKQIGYISLKLYAKL